MHAEEMIDTALDRSLDGEVVLVTGDGSGIGLAVAAGFAALGASVRAWGREEGGATQAAA
jgi:NAD(P)-dependent dehydrogenase (short-subunit alcohol dehydrogenase family)